MNSKDEQWTLQKKVRKKVTKKEKEILKAIESANG